MVVIYERIRITYENMMIHTGLQNYSSPTCRLGSSISTADDKSTALVISETVGDIIGTRPTCTLHDIDCKLWCWMCSSGVLSSATRLNAWWQCRLFSHDVYVGQPRSFHSFFLNSHSVNPQNVTYETMGYRIDKKNTYIQVSAVIDIRKNIKYFK